jgi:hypothetical protein
LGYRRCAKPYDIIHQTYQKSEILIYIYSIIHQYILQYYPTILSINIMDLCPTTYDLCPFLMVGWLFFGPKGRGQPP